MIYHHYHYRQRTTPRRRGGIVKHEPDALTEIDQVINKTMQWLAESGTSIQANQMALGLALLQEFESEFINFVDPERLYQLEMERGGGYMRDYVNKKIAKLWIDHSRGVLCARFPFKQEVIDMLRDRIPKGKKEWSAEEKIWHFSVEVAEEVTDIMFKFFDDVIDLTKEAPQVAVISKDSLLSLLDQQDIKEIYRMLAKKYHPDVNPTFADKMAKINVIFKEVKNGK